MEVMEEEVMEVMEVEEVEEPVLAKKEEVEGVGVVEEEDYRGEVEGDKRCDCQRVL